MFMKGEVEDLVKEIDGLEVENSLYGKLYFIHK